jgi:UTP:GlnB (protein PII) uridylyltransferase
MCAGEAAELHTVFQIAGPETPGLLAEVTQLLSHNGLEIRTAAVRALTGGQACRTDITC